jgi:hypothetical protein
MFDNHEKSSNKFLIVVRSEQYETIVVVACLDNNRQWLVVVHTYSRHTRKPTNTNQSFEYVQILTRIVTVGVSLTDRDASIDGCTRAHGLAIHSNISGFLGKNIQRVFNQVWNYIVKGLIGTVGVCLVYPASCLIISTVSLITGVLSPIWYVQISIFDEQHFLRRHI